MQDNTLARIHERVNLLNQIHRIECTQIELEVTYAVIEQNLSKKNNESSSEEVNALEDIELRMSILEEKYNNLQQKLSDLSIR